METDRRTGTIITANRLRDGRVVFLGAGGWTTEIADATVATDEQERRALEALARQSVVTCEVVAPYPVDVVDDRGRPVPVALRERWRIFGPGPGTETGYAGGGEAGHVPV